jgi:hypothetical protein
VTGEILFEDSSFARKGERSHQALLNAPAMAGERLHRFSMDNERLR